MDDDNSFSGASTSEANNYVVHIPVDELSSNLSGKLKVNSGNQTSNTIDRFQLEDEYETDEEDEDEDFSEEELLAQMGYAKSTPKQESAKGPRKNEIFNEVDEENDEDDDDLSSGPFLAQMGNVKKEPVIRPEIHTNLIPALKGSRERLSGPAGVRRVSWAPDVYDPPPTYSEFLVPVSGPEVRVRGSGRKNRQKDKKSGGSKSGVEGGKTGGAKGKDKKYGDKKRVEKRRGGSGGSKYSKLGEF
ncbi:hypothetical protein STAS_00043 [Striga asiatica]|uniref:Uncharacterized protein n=1 Tax=Striga asiatica TaxID=4170 RepID=A0A5A7NV38_STRAF|nr:hypothetical protein STAS_00043 [Striga asiatica]